MAPPEPHLDVADGTEVARSSQDRDSQ
jgi:hypothetical protein